jgi:hypothetical protein
MASATDARNARLNALQSAAQAWATSRTTYLTNQVAVLTNILQGRTGSQQLANAGVAAASDLVVSSINDFLVGS